MFCPGKGTTKGHHKRAPLCGWSSIMWMWLLECSRILSMGEFLSTKWSRHQKWETRSHVIHRCPRTGHYCPEEKVCVIIEKKSREDWQTSAILSGVRLNWGIAGWRGDTRGCWCWCWSSEDWNPVMLGAAPLPAQDNNDWVEVEGHLWQRRKFDYNKY